MLTYNEQQIHQELSRASEQEEINHIKWLLTKNTPFVQKKQQQDISMWTETHHQPPRHNKQKPLFPLFRDKQNRIEYKNNPIFKMLTPDQATQYLQFSSNQEARMPKAKSYKVQAKRVNLRLSLPESLQYNNSISEEACQSERYLPSIKKGAIPIGFLRSMDRKKTDRQIEQNTYYRKFQQSYLLLNNLQEQDKEEPYNPKKGKLLRMTKRKCSPVKIESPRLTEEQDAHRLRDCITFMK